MWSNQQFGTLADPVRQSDLNELAGGYGCARRLAYRKEFDADGLARPRERARISTILGTAVHAVIAYYLTELWAPLKLRQREPDERQVRDAFANELALAAEGLPIDWQKTNRDAATDEATAMILGAVASVVARARSIVLVEAPFLVELDVGAKEPYVFKGTIDLAYEGEDGRLHLADWKTGVQKPHPIVLHHGYQLGIYAHALEHGTLWPDDATRQTVLGRYPDTMSIVHLRNFVPYKRKTTKTVGTRDEAAFYTVDVGAKVVCLAGDPRGPAWFTSGRTSEDMARLRHSVRMLVAMVRMGHMPERIGEHCSRCPFRGQCLEQGHLDRADARKADRALAAIDLDGLDELDF